MASGKFELLDRVLPKFIKMGHKTLIFSQFTQLLNVMGDFLEYRGIEHLKLDGGMKQEDRNANMITFNDPNSKYHVFLLSTRAGG
jgi:ATP-dependent helicase STH1/SNF2